MSRHPSSARRALRIPVAALLILGLCATALVARGNAQGDPRAAEQPADALRVLRRSPDDADTEIAADASLLVQFNAAVQPLTTLAETPVRPAVSIDPPVAGTGRWLTSSMYRFQPADGWSPSTRYSVSVPAGLTGLNGEAQRDRTSWSFTTVAPAVVDVSPGVNTNQVPLAPGASPAASVGAPATGTPPPRLPPTVLPIGTPVAGAAQPAGAPRITGPVPPTVDITVVFNQPVDRAAAERALSLTPAITGAISWPNDRTMVLRPAAPLPRGTTYNGVVAAGVPSANGLLASVRPFTWTFTTARQPGIANTQPRQGDTSASPGFVNLAFVTPMNRASVEDRLILEPKPEGEIRFNWDPGETNLFLGFPGSPSTDYRLTLSPGAEDRFGGALDAPFTLSFRTAPLPPSVTLTSDSYRNVVPAGTSPAVTIVAVNVPSAEVALYAIDQPTFVTALSGRIGSELPAGATELRRRRVEFPNELDRRSLTPVPLADAPLDTGYYLLALRASQDNRLAQFVPFVVTRTHLTVKYSWNEVLVWALDYATGRPIEGVPLRILPPAGNGLAEARTDASGLASISLPNGAVQPSPLAVTGDRAGDAVLGYTGWSDGGGFPYGPSFTGFVATDRPLYRPGEVVSLQGIARLDSDAAVSIPTGRPITVRVTDPRGREVLNRPLTLDEFGAFNTEVTLDAGAATGRYQVSVSPDETRGAAAFASFQVAEFRRPEFNVAVATRQKDYDDGDRIDVTATARLFLGAPLPDATVRWRATAGPFAFSSPDFPGYSFTDPDDNRPTAVNRGEGEVRANRAGNAEFSVPTDLSNDPTSQVFTIEATVLDADNQAVSARTTARVHESAIYAGVRARGYVGTANRPAAVDLVTLARTGERAGGRPLTVRIVERRWMTTRTRDADGNDRYESRPEDREIETRELSTGPDGTAELTFIPPRGGLYRVVVSGRDASDRAFRAATSIWVSDREFTPWRVTNDNRIELTLDKTEYQPGDVARVLVPAPFEGAIGLVTVERAGILSREVRPFESNSTVLEIPLTDRHMPNVFVSVVLFKAGDGDAAPQYRSGSIEIPVSADSQLLRVTVTPDPEKTGPRGEVTFKVKTTDATGRGVPAELSMALVDEAVLSLTTDKPASAFTTLYRRRPLGVQTSAAARAAFNPSLALPRTGVPTPARTPTAAPTAAAARPVDAGETVEGEVRSDFRFTADWRPAVRTDAQGNGSVTVRMPDTLTTWRMTARGATVDSKSGLAEATVTTSKPVVVRPIAPRFLTAGDRPQIGAVVNNLTDVPIEVRAAFTASGLTMSDGDARTVRIEPGAQEAVYWSALVDDPGVLPPGETRTVKLKWSVITTSGPATVNGTPTSDAVELELPLRPFATPEVVASSGAVKDSATEVVRGPGTPGVRADDVTVQLWPSLTAALPETVRYLSEHPWESLELTADRILTSIGVAQARGEAPNGDALDRWLARLVSSQGGDGGWGWWYTMPSDPAISAYVVLALDAARRADRRVEPQVFSRAATYLKAELDRTRDVRFTLNPNQQALLIYALTLADPNELPRAFALAERRDVTGPEGRALLALAMQRAGITADEPRLRPLLSDLISSASISAAAASWDDPVSLPSRLTTATRTTALALQALAAADVEHPVVDDAVRWLMNERREGRWASTQESALAVLALGAVAQARGEGDAAYTARVALNDRTLLERDIEHAGTAPAATLLLRSELTAGDNRLFVSRSPADAPGRLYYQLSYRYASPAGGIVALDRGVAVARELLDPETDAPLTRVKAGSLVKVRITVLASSSMNYLAVEDYLPAGLEPADPTLATTSTQIGELLSAERQQQDRLRRENCRLSFRYCFSPFRYVDLRDDRVSLFARDVPKGVYEYAYFARAATPGTYAVRPTYASEVYFPDVFGRTDSGLFVVEP